MSSVRIIIAVISAISILGCDEGERELTPADSERVFDTASALVHEVHFDLLDSPPFPETYTHPCTDGGTMEMTTTFKGEGTGADNLDDLLHTFVGCQEGGLILDGAFDYTSIVRPFGVSCFEFDIAGRLQVSGELQLSCDIAGREACSGVTVNACGHDI